jgi:hypothetical protein
VSLKQRWFCFPVILLLVISAGCGGSGSSTVSNTGLYGNWNITMYPTGSSSPTYVFALAMSQEGSSNYSGGSLAYTGGVAAPSGMCINANALTATASTSGTNFTMTITDTSSGTVIYVTGSLTTQTTTLTGSYSNAVSNTCSASSGTVTMVPQ